MSVVYVVIQSGLVETVWTDPLQAIEACERFGSRGGVAVRPTDSEWPTAESNAAQDELRRMLAERR